MVVIWHNFPAIILKIFKHKQLTCLSKQATFEHWGFGFICIVGKKSSRKLINHKTQEINWLDMMYECYKKPYFQIYKSMFQIVSGSSLSSFPTSLLNIPFILSIWVLLPDLCFSSKRPWASDPLPLLCSTTSPLFCFLFWPWLSFV